MKLLHFTLCLFFSLAMAGQEVNPNKYSIKVGEQVEILTNTFEFLKVTMDSRCPKDVTCVMAGLWWI